MTHKDLKLTSDTWLTGVLQFPSFKVSVPSINDYLDWNKHPSLSDRYFVTIRTGAEDLNQLHYFEGQLVFIQKMNQYYWDSKPYPLTKGSYVVRNSSGQDVGDILVVGLNAFELSRFHRDTRFSHETAEKIKSRWLLSNLTLRKNCETLILVNPSGEIVGFSSILSYPDRLVIDLISVSPKFRGQGLGKLLVYHSQELSYGKNLPLIVGTQSENVANILYRNMGFKFVESQNVWHDIKQE